jgi:hypothetical protein
MPSVISPKPPADPSCRESARRQAEAVLYAFFESMGWSFTVKWAG